MFERSSCLQMEHRVAQRFVVRTPPPSNHIGPELLQNQSKRNDQSANQLTVSGLGTFLFLFLPVWQSQSEWLSGIKRIIIDRQPPAWETTLDSISEQQANILVVAT